VTIGVGFECRDGVVLCADEQITWPGSHKHYENKIYLHRWSGCTVAFTFAGDPDLMRSFDGKFEAAMKNQAVPHTGEKIQALVEWLLDSMSILDTEPLSLLMLCGIVIPDAEMRLIKTRGKIVSRISEETGYEFVGSGECSLLRYLVNLLVKRQSGEFIERHACTLGAFLVCRAVAFADDCGGDTDILVLHPDGMPEWRSNDAHNIEQNMLRIESQVRNSASLFFDRRVSDEDFSNQLDYLVSALKQEHGVMRIHPFTDYERET